MRCQKSCQLLCDLLVKRRIHYKELCRDKARLNKYSSESRICSNKLIEGITGQVIQTQQVMWLGLTLAGELVAISTKTAV